MYKPLGSQTLNEPPQRRLLIQGFPGTGKSHSALTFPNVTVGNHDRNLGAHHGRTDIVEVPFYSKDYYKSNRRDAYLKFLEKEALSFEQGQTYVEDSWTALQDAFDEQTLKEPVYGSNGKEDKFAFWGRKLEFGRQACDTYKKMRCDVVVTCHEVVERDDDNRITGLRPLQQGSFADKLGSYFTDVFRQLVQPKVTGEKLNSVKLDQYGCKNIQEFNAIQSEFPGEVMYIWQTKSDGIARCKTCLVGAPLYIPALFKYYVKYERKP